MSRTLSGLVAAAVVVAVALGGCGLTITNEPRPYEKLESFERDAIDRILNALRGVDAALVARGHQSIARLIDRDAIDVGFRHQISALNVGEGKLHISVWENLSDEQQQLVRKWFGASTLDAAATTYRRFFYDYLATALGFKEFMYVVLTPSYVHFNKSAYTIERHTQRSAAAYFVAAGQQASMWGFVNGACAPMRQQYDARWGQHFDQEYIKDHLHELSDPTAPTGYAYFICRFFELAQREMVGFSRDVLWLKKP